MIHWYWIPVILSVGVCIGILVAGLLWSARGMMMAIRDDKMTAEEALLALFIGGVMGILLIAVLVTV